MADYIYLLQTRLTPAQQTALAKVRDLARAKSLTVFLVGGAVRDLTSGSPIRDLDVAVQGPVSKLKKELEKAGFTIDGESDLWQSLYLHHEGGVRIELGPTLSVTYPKPGKPVVKTATILDDLRRRDFTANAMAISLNEGSYGLLMDPLNGVADIENRELRLVSNYGFIEDPVRMVRATRFGARLGWAMEEKTQQRYNTGKEEGYISALHPTQRAYETEEILHEEDPLRALRRLESEGWMKPLFPALTSKGANETEISRLRDMVGQLEQMGIHPDPSAAFFPLMTAKMAPKDVSALKKSFVRPGFATQIAQLEAEGKAFGTKFMGKEAAAPSAAWKMLADAVPEQALWLAHNSKSGPVQAKFNAYFNEWPSAQQRIPYTLMQEMRITPDLPIYPKLIEDLFFAIMDKKLETPEEAKAFLEPFSPPAPPPPPSMRRRAVKREVKAPRSRAKAAKAVAAPVAVDAEPIAIEAAAVVTPAVAKKAVAAKAAAPVAAVKKVAAAPAKAAPKKVAAPVKKAVKVAAKKAVKPVAAKKAAKPVAKKAVAKKVVAKKAAKPAVKKAVAKKVVAKKAVAKKVVKAPAKKAPVKKGAAAKKVAGKKAVAKKGSKR